MLARVPEAEVMDSNEEARDYDAMDHRAVNERFCEDFLALAARARSHATSPTTREGAPLGRVLDVGTGTARIPILLCARSPATAVVGIDLAESMLRLGRANVREAGLDDRIQLEARDAKRTGYPDGAFDAVICNTILHHIPRPEEALVEMVRLVRPGGALFVRDLFRPPSDESVAELVRRHGGETPETGDADVRAHLRQVALFEASLRAGLTVAEVQDLVRELPARDPSLPQIPPTTVSATSDRHWTLAWTRPFARA